MTKARRKAHRRADPIADRAATGGAVEPSSEFADAKRHLDFPRFSLTENHSNKSQTVLEALLTFTNSLTEIADEAASAADLTEAEKETLRLYRDELRSTVADLIRIFRRDGVLPDGSFQLLFALQAAYMIGSRAIRNPIMERLKRASAANARQSKKPESETKDALILGLAKPVWEKQPRWRNNRIAVNIRSTLNARLGERGLSPMEVDAIRKRVDKIRTAGQASG